MKRFLKFLGRIFRGEDVVLVKQSKEHWDAQFADGKWDRLQEGQPNTAEIARLISDYANTKKGRIRVLDVGCGNGGLAFLIASEPSINYTGIDISENALAVAHTFVPSGRFIVADAEKPPSDIGFFDILVFNEVFFYINPDRALPQYRAHTAAGAYVFISVIRSWRTPFIFRRICRHLHIDKRFRIAGRLYQWDIAVGHFV